MGKPKSGRSGGAVRTVGPSEITYAEAGRTKTKAGPVPSLNDLPPDRRKKVERICREIRGGKYETREKLEKAIERMLKEIL